MSGGILDGAADALRGIGNWLLELLLQPYVLLPALAALVRAMGVTVESGNTGLLFTFGRARKEIPPGFRLLAPFVQVVRILPTRTRTLDLPAQRVTTFDGLVYEVDTNLVYRIDDVRKAWIEVDDLGRGMMQMLGLSVQEVLRESGRETLRVSEELDARLERSMADRLASWGVVVERAGFTSIRPSPKTLRLTQLGLRLGQRRDSLRALEAGGLERALALPMLGTAVSYVRRAERARREEIRRGRTRRIRKVVKQVVDRSEIRSPQLRLALARRAQRALAR